MKNMIVGPLVLVTIGLLFLLSNFGFHLPIRELFRSFGSFVAHGWPLILIVIGIAQLVTIPLQIARGKRGFLVGPVTLVTLGCLFLLQQWHWVSFRFSWPVLLIAIGLALFFQNALIAGGVAGRAFRRFGGFR